MMVSSLPCSKNADTWRWLALALLSAFMFAAGAARAAGIEAQYFEVVPVEDHYELNAAFTISNSTTRLEELVTRGVALPFVAEFQLKSPRWYWWDEVVADRAQEFRLTYHALTRQFRLNSGGIQRSFGSLDEALRAVLALRNWPVVERHQLMVNQTYTAALRLRLDLSRLPKPFQVAALGDTELDLNSGWLRWAFLASPRDAR